MQTSTWVRWQKACALVLSLFLPAIAQAQTTVLSGRVVTEAGTPVAGAQVIIAAVNAFATAGEDGRYTLNVPAARVRGQTVDITARFLGYKPVTRQITLAAGASTQDFTLERDVSRLSQVVVTGVAGATEQRKLPFSVTSINAEDLPVPATNPLSALQGRVPGANIVSASGRPGASPSILLRAPTSLDGRGDGQGPLIIVDGIILNGTLADISPLDIATIEVVRGAAAASLYGAGAGKGVIQVTTKSGANAVSGGARFAVRSEYGQSNIERQFAKAKNHAYLMTKDGQQFCNDKDCTTPFDYLSELEGLNSANTTVVQSGPLSPFTGDQWMTYQDGEFPTRTYNAIEQIQRNGAFLNNDLSVSGRSGPTNYYASYNQFRQEGSIIGLAGYLRNNFRLNLDQRFGTDWTLSLRSQYTQSREDGNQFDGGGPFFTLTRMPANVSVLARDTLGRRYVRIALDGENSNPVYDLENHEFRRVNDRFLMGTNLKYIATNWLDFEGNVAVDRTGTRDRQFRDKGFRTLRAEGLNNGTLSESDFYGLGMNGSLQANMRKSFLNDELQTRWQLRYLYEQQEAVSNNFNGNQFAVGEIITGSNLRQNTLNVSSGQSSVRQIGYFAIANLEWKGRYILDGVVRRDGSSLFGADERWATFGRGSLAWRVSDESWFSLPGITDWKLRYSIGQAGTRPVFSAQYETYSVGGGIVDKANLGNSDIKVQVSTEQEIGTDIQLFDRYTVNINRATNVVTDQLVEANLPAAAGFARQWRNAGTVETKAWEVSITLPLIDRPDLTWSITGLWDQSSAQITKLSIPAYQFGPNTQGANTMFFAREGERIGTIYGTKFATQCSELPGALRATCATEFQVNDDGYLVWVGAGNNWQDGIADSLWGTAGPTLAQSFGRANQLMWGTPFTGEAASGTTYQALGNTLPRYRFGISNTLTYKDLSFFGLLDASIGQKVYNLGRHWSYFERYSAEQDQAGRTDATRKPYGYYGTLGLYNALQPNSHFVEDASFAKLRELSVSYRLRSLPGLGGDWNVSLIGRNVFTITNYTGFDPETGRTGGRANSAAINGVDAFVFPNLRTFTLAIGTSF